MLSKKMTAAFNGQIAAELYSSYLYTAMAAWLRSEGHSGAAAWMGLQVREELFHAQKFYTHILDRGGQVRLSPVDAPPAKWNAPQDVFEAVYDHEQKITALINNLMTMAKGEGDHASEIFLQWFVAEQIEEEAGALDVARKYRLAAGQGAGPFMIDQELGTRTLSPAARDALTGAAPAAQPENKNFH